jgi:amino acid adenylation domain-containing protein
VPRTLRIRGPVDVAALEAAYTLLHRRHEVLRTTFPTVAGRPVQRIRPPVPFVLPRVDLSGLGPGRREAELGSLIAAAGRRLFDLDRGPLLRATLIHLGGERHALVQGEHHLVHDGWTEGVLARDLLELYRWLAEEAPAGAPALPELPIQFADFAAWQRRWMRGEVLEGQLAYWRRELAGAPERIELPTDRPRPAVLSSRGGAADFHLPVALGRELRSFCRGHGTTLFMTLLAAFEAVLQRYGGGRDMVVGTGVANRRVQEIEGLIGMVINTLALRTRLDDTAPAELTFGALLGRVREVCLGAYAHQDVPFEMVVEAVNPRRSLSHAPLFQVMFAFYDAPRPELEVAGLELESEPSHNSSAKFDLLLIVTPPLAGDGEIGVHAEWSSDLYDRTTVLRLLDHYRRLLAAAIERPGTPLPELPLASRAERQQLLREWNDTASAYPRGATVHALVAEQARRRPAAVALETRGEAVSYGELAARAGRLARELRRRGVGAETRVALCLERSPGMVVATLAVLAAGGAYLPLDPEYPAPRLAFLLEDAGAPVVVTRGRLRDRLPELDGSVAVLDLDRLEPIPEPHVDSNDETNAEPGAEPNAAGGLGDPAALAYVMYTSGSTGRPKGVAVPHRAVVRLVRETDYARLDAGQTVLHAAPASFDAATLELWGALANGGKLVLAPPGPLSPEELGAVVERARVTTLWLTAALFQQLVQGSWRRLRGVRQLLAGGDVLPVAAVETVLRELPGTRLVNGYGPTENTTFTSCQPVAAGSRTRPSVPIGRPIAATRVHLLDRGMRPVPIGVAGELHAGGDGLARGYLGRPRRTAERFVPDPFATEPGSRLYATGDRVRHLPGGELDFLGRVDHQVKVRGFRVELGEVEAAIGAAPGVEEVAVVLHRPTPDDARLVAWVVPAAGTETGPAAAAALSAALRERLPVFMVPSLLVPVDALPLTPNGKVDRAALARRDPGGAPRSGEYEAPETPVARELAALWSELLGAERVGLHDSFFELGGHSLMATQMINRVREELGVEIRLRELFETPTLEEVETLVVERQMELAGDDELARLLEEVEGV